jgi:hypothetical protein
MRDDPIVIKEVIQGCVSPETAHVVPDYPYGFRLRCQIRYWLEQKPGHGTRLVSQTTNPKQSNVFDRTANKPKHGTYNHGLCLLAIVADNDHVHLVVLNDWYGPKYHAEVRRFWDVLTEVQQKIFAMSEQLSRRYHVDAWAAWDAEQAAQAERPTE